MLSRPLSSEPSLTPALKCSSPDFANASPIVLAQCLGIAPDAKGAIDYRVTHSEGLMWASSLVDAQSLLL